MQNKRIYLIFGVAILLVALAASVAGKWITSGPSSEERVSNVTPAPENPTTTPEISGLLVDRKDNLIVLQSVSFDAGAGSPFGDASESMDSSSGPKVEVLITGDRLIADVILGRQLK